MIVLSLVCSLRQITIIVDVRKPRWRHVCETDDRWRYTVIRDMSRLRVYDRQNVMAKRNDGVFLSMMVSAWSSSTTKGKLFPAISDDIWFG
jgi:hypothetical protein